MVTRPIGIGALEQCRTGAPAAAFTVAHVGAAGAEALGPQFVNQLKSGSSGGVHPVCSDATRHGSGLSKSALSSAQAGTLGHSVRNAVAWGLEREKSPAFDGCTGRSAIPGAPAERPASAGADAQGRRQSKVP